jgi:mRNA deadenylase 3'-5' endonuclease subunit Ccr4
MILKELKEFNADILCLQGILCVLFKLFAMRCVPKFCAPYLEVDHVEDFYGDALHALGYASYQYHDYTL